MQATLADRWPGPGPEWAAGYEAARRQAINKHVEAARFFTRLGAHGQAAVHLAWADTFLHMEATDGF